MSDIAKLFEALSERAYKENDLSDATYAMCAADIKFRQYFLDFFFQDAHLCAKDVTLEREHTVQLTLSDKTVSLRRPDFWIVSPKGVFIVEVKIWDGNHHFEDYCTILANENNVDETEAWKRLGYIANYKVPEEAKGKCHVALWKEFIEGIDKYACYDDPVIKAYVGYVKRLCPFDDFKVDDSWTINTKDFLDIQRFEINLVAAIENVPGLKPYRTTRCFRSQQWMGQYFEWTIGESGNLKDKKVWGWIGARYKKDGAVVCVEFEDKAGWGDLICVQCAKYINGGVLRFCAKDSAHIAQKPEALEAFLRAVLNLLQSNNQVPCENDIFWIDYGKERGGSLSKPLLAMKCLPFVLENNLITDKFKEGIAKVGFEFTLVHGNDEEEPESHCGRYFELRHKNNSGNAPDKKIPVYRGWIGVDYNSNCRRDDKDGGTSYSAAPSFTIEITKAFPDATDWLVNSWKWKYADIVSRNAPQNWKDAFRDVRDMILKLCSIQAQDINQTIVPTW